MDGDPHRLGVAVGTDPNAVGRRHDAVQLHGVLRSRGSVAALDDLARGRIHRAEHASDSAEWCGAHGNELRLTGLHPAGCRVARCVVTGRGQGDDDRCHDDDRGSGDKAQDYQDLRFSTTHDRSSLRVVTAVRLII